MGTLFVILDHPLPYDFTDLIQILKQIGVQHLFPESAVEALDESVLVGLAGLDVAYLHAIVLAPPHEGLTQQFRAVAWGRPPCPESPTTMPLHQGLQCVDDLAVALEAILGLAIPG